VPMVACVGNDHCIRRGKCPLQLQAVLQIPWAVERLWTGRIVRRRERNSNRIQLGADGVERRSLGESIQNRAAGSSLKSFGASWSCAHVSGWNKCRKRVWERLELLLHDQSWSEVGKQSHATAQHCLSVPSSIPIESSPRLNYRHFDPRKNAVVPGRKGGVIRSI